jgi:hypothetical protein
MPLSFARFPLAVHPSGILAKDGQLYVIVSGISTAIFSIAPTLAVNLSTVGGTGIGMRWAAVLWIYGRVITFSGDLESIVIVTHIVNASTPDGIPDLKFRNIGIWEYSRSEPSGNIGI